MKTFALLAAALLAITITGAQAATFVYRKPMPAGVKCATAAACAIQPAGGPSGPPETPQDPETPVPPAPTPAFDASIIMAQARYVARWAATGAGGAGYMPQATAAAPSATWQIGSVDIFGAIKYRVIALGVNSTTGAATYSVVTVADDSEEARAPYSAYLGTTFGFNPSFRTNVSLAVKPEVCRAVSSIGASDVSCAGNVLTARFTVPETPVYFPNSGPFAVFGGYNLQNAGAYNDAVHGWRNTGPYPN